MVKSIGFNSDANMNVDLFPSLTTMNGAIRLPRKLNSDWLVR
ncbi:MAG: hypothetical protein PWP45_666 [Tepidanaerobacteraceae bacterium]|nr:hypothetical protein [Tepidanaerobacteraceae bacterium]